MNTRKTNGVAILILLLASTLAVAATSAPKQASAPKPNDDQLLKVRETVWRSWFAGDTQAVADLVPPETIVMSSDEPQWKYQAEIVGSAREFHAQGGKLLRLEFPRTEVQHFGDVAVVWSNFLVETELGGKRSVDSGRVTEIFVWQHGHWTNPGWHTDNVK